MTEHDWYTGPSNMEICRKCGMITHECDDYNYRFEGNKFKRYSCYLDDPMSDEGNDDCVGQVQWIGDTK